uniref:Uncharacterized protein n=1 Tax=Rhizophora mucronata TaxID=61149 RepID=A0A2P2NMK9_RHIMU
MLLFCDIQIPGFVTALSFNVILRVNIYYSQCQILTLMAYFYYFSSN